MKRADESYDKPTQNTTRVLSTEDFVRRIKRRIEGERAKQYDESMRMLIPQIGEKAWGEKRVGNKVDMIGEMVKFKPRINTGNDNACMKKYLYRVSRDGLDQPSMLRRDQFLPVDAPLLDYLVESSKNVVGWKYPRLEDLEYYQANRGLSLEMLKQVEVKELVCGRSTKEEILEVARWVERMHTLDQEKFGTQVISLDVEDVKVTFYDNLRMAGKIQIPGGQAPLRTAVEKDMIYGYMKDTWKPIPGKIMFGNGITWTCLISLDLEEEEMEDVVILDEGDLEDEAGGSALSSGLPVESMELEVQSPAPKKKRLTSAPKVSRNVRVRTYDELIEGSDKLAYDDLDFEFEVPKEVEEIEV